MTYDNIEVFELGWLVEGQCLEEDVSLVRLVCADFS